MGSGHFLGMSSPSSVRHSGQGTPQLKQIDVLKPGHGTGLVDGEGAVFFRMSWIFSPPLILAPLYNLFGGSIPWFPSPHRRIDLFFFHPCLQIVEGSRIQKLAHEICHHLVHLPRELHPFMRSLKWTARQLYHIEAWETRVGLYKAWPTANGRCDRESKWLLCEISLCTGRSADHVIKVNVGSGNGQRKSVWAWVAQFSLICYGFFVNRMFCVYANSPNQRVSSFILDSPISLIWQFIPLVASLVWEVTIKFVAIQYWKEFLPCWEECCSQATQRRRQCSKKWHL